MKKTEYPEWLQIFYIPGSVESPGEGWTRKNPWRKAQLCPDFESTIADESPQTRLCGACAQCVFAEKLSYYCRKGH